MDVVTTEQSLNSEGALVYEQTDIDRLRRFLCFGSELGTYYTGNDDHGVDALGLQNVESITRLIEAGRGEEIVNELASFSLEGRAAKRDSLLFVLAMCARLGDEKTKQRAYEAVNQVCRIPTHLFYFIELCQNFSTGSGSGWGRAHRRAICNWYLRFRENPLRLARLVTKYRKRKDRSHKDVLRLAHLKPDSPGVALVVRYIIKGLDGAVNAHPDLAETPVEIVNTLSFLKAVEEVKRLGNNPDDVQRVCEAIRRHNLVREHVPTQLLNSIDVWKALLINMPLTAMIRNLGKMTSMKMLGTGSEGAVLVVEKLHSDTALRYARIHPFNVLLAMFVYQLGQGEQGSLHWQPNPDVVRALDNAFYLSFKYVQPTGKRFLVAIDLSRSMTSPVTGYNVINSRQAAAALSMITARREQHREFVGFSDSLVPIDITTDMSLPEVIGAIGRVPEGDTDCAAPILWATRENKQFDVFIVYTDSETQIGRVPPAHALREYRLHSGIRAKLIVCAFASNGFTLADPNDPGMLDMAGFDSNGPDVMNTFITAM